MTAPPFPPAHDDAETAHDPDAAEEATEPQEAPDPSGQSGGWYLDHPDGKEVRQHLIAQIKAQNAFSAKRRAKERCWELTRAGWTGLQVTQRANSDEDYFVRADFDGGEPAVGNNTLSQLIRRKAAVLTTDPPLATVTANSDIDRERLASELAERILRVEGASVNRDDAGHLRQMLDLAGTYGSMLNFHFVDPQGGGLQPQQIMAHPQATTVQDALTPMTPGRPAAQDPSTGAWMPEQPPAPIPVLPGDLIKRYVRLDGSLTETQAEAKLIPQSATRERMVRPAQVTFLPFGADAFNAEAAFVAEIIPLSEVISRFYDGVRPDEEVVKKLVAWKPVDLGYDSWIPNALKGVTKARSPLSYPGNDGLIDDSAPCAVICCTFTSGSLAPLGAYIVIAGVDTDCLKREPWKATVGEGEDAQVVFLPLPVAQLRDREDLDGDPFGVPTTEDLAKTSALKNTFLTYLLNYCYIAANRNVFIPITSPLQPDALQRRDGTPIPLDPGPDSQPFYEPIPPMDGLIHTMYEELQAEEEKDSGLNQAAATGEAPANVTSGTQLAQVIDETRVGLTGNIQNLDRYFVQNGDIRLSMIRAFTGVPKLLTYTGESGDVQQREFTGAELLHYGDIQIAKDSSTMLTRNAKMQLLQGNLQLAMQSQDAEGIATYKEQLSANQNPLLGVQDDPIKARIQRQISDWRQGARRMQPTEPAQAAA